MISRLSKRISNENWLYAHSSPSSLPSSCIAQRTTDDPQYVDKSKEDQFVKGYSIPSFRNDRSETNPL